MSKVDDYRRQLRGLSNWVPFLLKESGLPGPRGNLELAQAFYSEASRDQILELAALGPSEAPENTAKAFLAFCGIMSLGKLAAEGDATKFAEMRRCASDPRWRIREAVATGLQYAADTQMDAVLRALRSWASGNWYEKRAAAAALCEPRLLKSAATARATLTLLDRITRSMLRAPNRSDEAFRVLRQGMAYCWSVAIAAAPEQGKPLFEKWLTTTDSDIRWMLRQNLSKNRLVRMDPTWVNKCLKAIPE
ncbi:MAG TPA: hypothetical protein VFH29_02020 [Anaerolineales bacterium]|nr:hypothetical protein [Anaerolineales bacterium]